MSKRTIVVFNHGKQLWYSELADQEGKPVKGEFYVFGGIRYEVVDVTQSLGAMSSDGKTPRSGQEKLLELMAVVCGEAGLVGLTMTNIGSGDDAQKASSAGGVLLSTSAVAGGFDHVVFVRLKTDRKSVAVSPIRLSEMLAANFTAGDAAGALKTARGGRQRKK